MFVTARRVTRFVAMMRTIREGNQRENMRCHLDGAHSASGKFASKIKH